MEDRLCLLSAEECLNNEPFVEKKMREATEGILESHYSIDELVDL
jgi:hypothetical protein